MSTTKLLVAELLHRRGNFILSLLAMVAAATLFVAGPTIIDGYRAESSQRLEGMRQETDRELEEMQQQAKTSLDDLDKRTKRIMRDLGFNLRIVHRDTDLTELYTQFISFDMPESYVQQLADSPEISKIVHLVASLKQMIQWNGKPRLLVGVAPEATQSHLEKKKPMGFQIKPGTVYLGHLAAEGLEVGQQVDIQGHPFEVGRILQPHGRRDEDVGIFMHLADAQKVLDKPGKISEILALGCKCKTLDRVEEITAQLELVLPDTKVTEHRLNAEARDTQRQLVTRHHEMMMTEYRDGREKIIKKEAAQQQQITEQLSVVNSFLTPLVVIVAAAWVGLLAWTNVRQRRIEIGLLRAVGKGSASIAALFLGKAVLLGLAGGLLGCALGTGLAAWLSRSLLNVSPDNFTPSALPLLATLLGAPLVAAMASYLPTLRAIAQDPAVVLCSD